MIFLNGTYTQKVDAKLGVDDRGFHFGDGMYDIMLIHNKKIIDFDAHFNRMKNTSDRMYLKLDYTKQEILNISHKLISSNNVNTGRLIIIISRGETDRWCENFDTVKQNFFIETQNYDCEIGKSNLKFLQLKLENDIRWAYRDIKITSLLPSVILRMEAKKLGFNEILYHNTGIISETSRGNIFIVKNNCVITPPLSQNLLPGITRYRVLQLLKENNINYEERDFAIDELLNADEVFSTSATARVVGVSLINNVHFGEHKITQKILQLYDNFVKTI